MLKQELLSGVKELAKQGSLSREELLSAYDEAKSTEDHGLLHKVGMAEILYYVGGGIVFLGIAVFIANHWDELSTVTKVLTTLGSGIAFYIVGVLFQQRSTLVGVSQAFFFIAALLLPLGLAVSFDQAGWSVDRATTQSIISGILLGVYLASFYEFRRSLFLALSIIFATWFFFSFTSAFFTTIPIEEWKFYMYRFLAAGASYIFLAHFLKKTTFAPMADGMYSLGALFILGAAIVLGGYSPDQNSFWEIVFPGIAFGFMFMSIPLKARGFLVFGAAFLMAYILKLTAEYFSDSLGWPLALVVCGLVLIGIGYGTFSINRRYIAK